jgi:hypothetical protein
MREWCSAAALVLMMLARADATSSNSFRQHEGHFQGDLVADHLCVVDGGLLVLHPAALAFFNVLSVRSTPARLHPRPTSF